MEVEREILKMARELVSVKVKQGWYYFSEKPKLGKGRSGAVGVLVPPSAYKHYLQGIGGLQGASMAENYIYHLPKKLNIFDDEDKGDLMKAYQKGILTLEPSEDSLRAEKEYGSIDELISELMGKEFNPIWEYIDRSKIKNQWDGFYHFKKKDQYVWAYVNPSEFKLIDGNVMRFEESGDVEAEFPEWVMDDLLRYTDMSGKNLKPATVKWLKENVPSKNRKLYRGMSFNYPDDDISKWIGVSDITDVRRGARVRIRRGRMSSWSVTPQTAKAFAMSGIKLLVAANVPASKIIIDFTQLSSKVKGELPFRAQNEVIVTGAVDSKIVGISVNSGTTKWLEKHGYGVDRNGIYAIEEKMVASDRMTLKVAGASQVKRLTKPYDRASLECDGLTRVLHTVLEHNGINHKVMQGGVETLGEYFEPHWWIEIGGGKVVDYRLKMWFGSKAAHGVFSPKSEGVEYDGRRVSMKVLEPWLFDALTNGMEMQEL